MRIGMVVDATCDMQREWLDEHKVILEPIKIHMGTAEFTDVRNAAESLRFYREHLGEQGHAAESTPFSVEQIRELFLTKLVLDYDFVFCMCIMSSRSPIYERTVAASREILRYYHPIRKDAGLKGIFQMRVLDSQTLFAGQAITVLEGVRMIEADMEYNPIYDRLSELAKNTYGYAVPRDVKYLRARAMKRGDRSVTWMKATLGTLLDIKPILRAYRNDTAAVGKAKGFDNAARMLLTYTADRVKKGLMAPYVNLSYGGELDKLRALAGYDVLARTCEEQGVRLGEAVMGLTGMVNIGEGALTVGFAAPEHEVKFSH
ncbi:MAG: DegV family protein [Proteobacteria bacterium]|nr:DegV family protein [Pseudomonadota bacterium]